MITAEDRALDALDPPAVLKDLRQLVAVASVTGDERGAAELVLATARRLRLHARLEEEDLAVLRRDKRHPGEEAPRAELVNVRVGRRGDGPRLALCAHLDVVGPGTAAWTHDDPYSGVLEEGRIYGRGSVDMKSGLVACLHALAAVGAAGIRTPAELLAVSSEEDGGLGAFAALLRDGDYAGCVIPEPTGFDVVCAQAGAITFSGVVEGVSAHAATRLAGVSAIDRYLPIHEALKRYETMVNRDVAHPLMRELRLPYPVLVGKVNSGTWSSQVPDRLEFEGRAPVRVGESVGQARANLRAAVAAVDPGVELCFRGGSFASAQIDPDHALARMVRGAATDELGRPIRTTGVSWGADMRLFVAAGIPTVMCGPSGIERAHAVDEWVATDEVLALTRVLIRVICRFGG